MGRIAELKAELKHLEEKKREEEKPIAIETPDFSSVIVMCQGYVDRLHIDGYVSEDLESYIFEAVMDAMFGKNIFEWINRR